MTSGAPRAPLLAVVGGPTGAGKSTLLNSLVRAPVSAAGVLRPTTRRPVLVCNPRDWASVRRHGLNPICAPLMPEGIAIIDAPDLDSIEPGNRAIAEELFAEADLWLFVTTASRYADAAAWRHLQAARERRVALAVVLDRVASGHAQGIIDHMRDLLGPPEPPLFLIPEASLDRQGMLPDAIAAPLRGWLADVVEGARSGPPRPAVGVAHVPVGNIATAADLAPETHSGAFGDSGLTVELELTHADPAPSRDAADFASQPDADVAAASVPVSPADPTPSDPTGDADDPAADDDSADPTGDPAPADDSAAASPETDTGARQAVDGSAEPEWVSPAEDEDYIEYELDLSEPAPEPAIADPEPPTTEPEADRASTGTAEAGPEAVEDAEGAAGEGARKGDAKEVAEGEKDGVPDAEAAEDADENPDVVESDPPDGRPADIPKAADVGETVKL